MIVTPRRKGNKAWRSERDCRPLCDDSEEAAVDDRVLESV
jgi:hypothetical protein